ncbi:endonuclease/exonuclease/phosphatase family protein, partial [Pyxidicoccus sp. 3LFB2]
VRPERMPELDPQRRAGYSEPQAPEDLPPVPPGGTGVLTLNTANGADEYYGTDENREAQADLIQETGASIVALQEVDVGLERSGGVNTALELVRKLNPAFDAFTTGELTPVPIGADAPPTAIREGADGTTLYQTPEGTLVTGESFSGDDRGGLGTRSEEATYGNAVYVAPPNRVVDAYTVVLPNSGGADPASGPPDLAALGSGPVTDAEREALKAYNEGIRDGGGEEPRTALVTRVVGPDGKEQSIINVHLAAGEENQALRDAQLAYLAQVVEAESKGPPAREVVVMGDFNDTTEHVGEYLGTGEGGAGLNRTVGGHNAGIENYDQIWTSSGLDTSHSAQVDTGGSWAGGLFDVFKGVSDHPNAGYTVIE